MKKSCKQSKCRDCKNNISNKSNNKLNDKSKDSKSFQLDENDEHSFELK